jgi:predicted TIM-barrel fold metal-dependent hydrolase
MAMGAAAAGAIALPAMAAESAPPWIDAHSHIWGRDVEKFPLTTGKTVADLDPPSFTAEELLATCEPLGVQQVVLIQHSVYHLFDNQYLVHEANRMPERFRVVGMLDDTQPDTDKKMKELADQHVTGFRITPFIFGRDKWLTSDGMKAMWQTGAETGQNMCCLLNPEDLSPVSRMCQQHPETPVVIDHFARIGADGLIRDHQIADLCDLARHAHVTVKLSAYYALGKKAAPYTDLIPMIRRVLDAFGPERCMWASDAPYQVVQGHTYEASLALIRDAEFLSAGDKEWLLRKTAARVFRFT